MIMDDLASRIREAAKEVGGLNALSKAISVPRRTLGYWLEGKQPKPDALEAIANKTGVSLEWLITGDGQKIASPLMKVLQRVNPRLATGMDLDEQMTDEEATTAFSRAIQRLDRRSSVTVPAFDSEANPRPTIRYYPDAASAGWGRAVLDDVGGEDLDLDGISSRLFGVSSKYACLFLVQGDSMLPKLIHGDIAVVDRRQRQIVDDEVFVFSLDDDLYIKRAKRGEDGALCWNSDNHDFAQIRLQGDEITRMKVVGRVTNVIRAV